MSTELVDLAVGLFGVLITALGVTGMVSPSWLIAFVARWQSRSGLYWVAGIRVVMGTALMLAAPNSRAPVFFQVFGAVAVLAGIATPFFGLRRFEALLDWWRELPPAMGRSWCAAVGLVGLSFMWAVFP